MRDAAKNSDEETRAVLTAAIGDLAEEAAHRALARPRQKRRNSVPHLACFMHFRAVLCAAWHNFGQKECKEERMRLIVGLGNPGDEYAHTRHNAGFDAVDDLAEQLRATYWKTECGALTAKVKYRGEELFLRSRKPYERFGRSR